MDSATASLASDDAKSYLLTAATRKFLSDLKTKRDTQWFHPTDEEVILGLINPDTPTDAPQKSLLEMYTYLSASRIPGEGSIESHTARDKEVSSWIRDSDVGGEGAKEKIRGIIAKLEQQAQREWTVKQSKVTADADNGAVSDIPLPSRRPWRIDGQARY